MVVGAASIGGGDRSGGSRWELGFVTLGRGVSVHQMAGKSPTPATRWLGFPAVCGLLLALALPGSGHAEAQGRRLLIQIWWDSPTIEMDPSDDPGRLQVYIGDVFVGCALAPAHRNYRKQLMLVPPSVGFTARGEAAAVKVLITGQLATLAEQHIKITELDDVAAKTPEVFASAN